jgi:hypothetical protein
MIKRRKLVGKESVDVKALDLSTATTVEFDVVVDDGYDVPDDEKEAMALNRFGSRHATAIRLKQ